MVGKIKKDARLMEKKTDEMDGCNRIFVVVFVFEGQVVTEHSSKIGFSTSTFR